MPDGDLYLFRGVRRPHDDALAHLLNLVAAPAPDPEAWRALAAIAREDHGPRAALFLAATLGGLLAHVDSDGRGATVEALADLLAAEGDARLTAALASDGEVPTRRLALAYWRGCRASTCPCCRRSTLCCSTAGCRSKSSSPPSPP